MDVLGLLVSVLGLVPMFISALNIEKHQNPFLERFWSIFGLVPVCLGAMIGLGNFLNVLTLLVLIILLMISIIYAFLASLHELIRKVITDQVVLPISLIIIIANYTNALELDIIIGVASFAILSGICLY